MPLEQREEIGSAYRETFRVFERHRGCRQVATLVDGRRPERITLPENLQDDFLAAWGRFDHFDSSLDDCEERVGRIPFLKDLLSAREAQHARYVDDMFPVVGAHPAEHVDFTEGLLGWPRVHRRNLSPTGHMTAVIPPDFRRWSTRPMTTTTPLATLATTPPAADLPRWDVAPLPVLISIIVARHHDSL